MPNSSERKDILKRIPLNGERRFRDNDRELARQAGEVFENVRRQMLEKGLSVVEASQDAIYRVYPNGNREFVKNIAPPEAATPGAKYKLR